MQVDKGGSGPQEQSGHQGQSAPTNVQVEKEVTGKAVEYVRLAREKTANLAQEWPSRAKCTPD